MIALSPIPGDNAPQIQAAVNSGQKVCLDVGIYECESAIVLERNQHSGSGLWGVGAWLRSATELYFINPDDAGIRCVGADDQTAIVNFFDLKSIALVGPGSDAAGSAHGIHFASTTEPRNHAPAGLLVSDCRIADWPGCGIYAPNAWQSVLQRTWVERCGEHGVIIGGAPNLELRQVFVRYCGDVGIWLQDGKPTVIGCDVAEVKTGVRVGRSKGDPYFAGTPYATVGGYCWPYIVDLQIEPINVRALHFGPGSCPSIVQGCRMYAAAETAVDGIRFDWMVPYSGQAEERYPYGELRDLQFLVKSGGSYSSKISAAGKVGADHADGAIVYFGPRDDVAADPISQWWIKDWAA